MGAKQEKKKRRVKKQIYEYNSFLWGLIEPPKWRFLKRKKWLSLKPKPPKGCK